MHKERLRQPGAERIEFNELLIDSPNGMVLPSTKNSSAVANSSRTGALAISGWESSTAAV